ncbi:hypothetical protein MHZ90_14465 [Pantoea sp. ACRSH]|uniref:BRO-N domain-containing protein n=1 Tax=unclassified Pantoea TaxID=2630326 RepID=UPI001EF63F4A|nr:MULTISPECIES: BRO family protein [unclassified Pantoea]MCG7367324.1 hypothetical protein [Pantoea sp. ACRSH]MCG7397617.1 hypothetical protein [Pantoea sp. ACRSC]
MSNSIITNVFESNEVRSVIIDNDPWFIAKDVAKALGYKRPDQAVAKHCEEAANLSPEMRGSLDSRLKVINESDVYNLVFGSKLESAQRFRKWVTKEVLPSIRKSGAFISGVSDNHSIDSELRSRITEEFARKGKDLLSDIDRHILYGNPKRHEVLNLCDVLSKRHGVPASLVEAMLFNGMKALGDF